MFRQTDTQSIQNTECSHMWGHQGGIKQYQSANKPSKCNPSPTHHVRSVQSGKIGAIRQQLFQNFINSPIRHKHTHRAASRQQTCQYKQAFPLSRYLEQTGQTFFLFWLFHYYYAILMWFYIRAMNWICSKAKGCAPISARRRIPSVNGRTSCS